MTTETRMESANQHDEVKTVLKEFAQTVGLQAQVTNRIWLGMITAAGVGILSRPSPESPGVVTVFSLPIPKDDFFLSVFAILLVLVIAFSAAYAAQARAQELAHTYLDSLRPTFTLLGFGSPRSVYDTLRLPTFNRVAPLPQLLDGKYQFGRVTGKAQIRLKKAKRFYYWVLKSFAVLAYFLCPGTALIYLGKGVWKSSGTAVRVGVLAAGSVACVALLEVLINDIRSGRSAANTVASSS